MSWFNDNHSHLLMSIVVGVRKCMRCQTDWECLVRTHVGLYIQRPGHDLVFTKESTIGSKGFTLLWPPWVFFISNWRCFLQTHNWQTHKRLFAHLGAYCCGKFYRFISKQHARIDRRLTTCGINCEISNWSCLRCEYVNIITTQCSVVDLWCHAVEDCSTNPMSATK